jgi:hypothetical protein
MTSSKNAIRESSQTTFMPQQRNASSPILTAEQSGR